MLRFLIALALLLSFQAASIAAPSCSGQLRSGMLPDDVKEACGEPPYVMAFVDLTVDASLPKLVPPSHALIGLLPEPFHMARVPEAIERLNEEVDRLRWELYQLRLELTKGRLASVSVYAEVWDYPFHGCTVAIMGKSVASGLRLTKYTCEPKPTPDDEVSARQRAYKLLFGIVP